MIEVEDDSGFTKIITPMNPSIKPNICLKVIFSFNQKKAIIIVLNAVVAFNIARIFESAPKLPKENGEGKSRLGAGGEIEDGRSYVASVR